MALKYKYLENGDVYTSPNAGQRQLNPPLPLPLDPVGKLQTSPLLIKNQGTFSQRLLKNLL